MLYINPKLSIPLDALEFQSTRSSGPGGQNVNKLETKIILRFDIAQSPLLSESQRERLLEQLASRLTNDGVLILSSQEHRSQLANREAAVARFVNLLREALKPVRRRIPTRPSAGARQQRLTLKKQRQRIKQQRQKSWDQDQ
ncbi:MAG: aminoacyl-tRNA hydrolase [Candidatus Melainabacteria bacterium HGW-Melainabacteria-1]|nr:MAG: aminoacyl-tRNA hydrolase [Candidatus Melainabacteria bacterium HGW-Melainabacteria-1]